MIKFVDSGRPSSRFTLSWAWLVLPAAFVAAILGGYLAGSQPVFLCLPALVVAPVIIWARPYYAVLFVLATATLIEALPYTIGTHEGAITASIPWWRTFTHGMILFPVEIFLLLVVVIWVMKAALEGTFNIPRSPVLTCFKVFWAILFVGVGVGLTHGAQLKYDFWELRSWLYLGVVFLLAASLLRTMRALDAVLWTFILGSGFKGVYGTVIFFDFARHMDPRPQEILGHEEAFFFGVFIVITVALWLYGVRGRMRMTATVLLPFVFIADLANARRTAWLILAACILVLFAIAMTTLPHRRRALRRTFVVLIIASAAYLPAYWNHTGGTISQPAQSVKSQVDPNSDARDQSSDLYRQQENLNLTLDIKSSGMLGTGFGIPIAYLAEITNISTIDPIIAYIPHNGVLWIWLRLGMQGEIAFWALISAAIVRACRLARAANPRLAMMGAIVASSIFAYAIDGYEDTGFAEFRIAVAMGCLLGLVEAAHRLARTNPGPSPGSDAEEPELVSLMGTTSTT
jgi:O-Antigen ligase